MSSPEKPTKKEGYSEREKLPEMKKPEKRRYDRVLRLNPSLVFAAALSAASPAEDIKAAELEPGVKWSAGVAYYKEYAINGSGETGGVFLGDKRVSGEWHPTGRQAPKESYYIFDTQEIGGLEDRAKDSGAAPAFVCVAHVHSLSSLAAEGIITKEEAAEFQKTKTGPSAPPSAFDFNIESQIKYAAAINSEHRSAVFDPNGVWYHRIIKGGDYAQFPEFEKELEERKKAYEALFGPLRPEKAESGPKKGLVVELLDSFSYDEVKDLHDMAGHGRQDDYTTIFPDKQERLAAMKAATQFRVKKTTGGFGDPVVQKLFAHENTSLEHTRAYTSYKNKVVKGSHDDYKAYDSAFANVVEKSKDGEVDDESLQQMYEALARNGAYARFVPYEKLDEEPPCAGPDYKPAN